MLGIESLDDVTVDPYLYSDYADEFDAFAAIEGNTLTIVSPDCNGDGVESILDANCTSASKLDRFLAANGTLPGDTDGMGGVDFADFLKLTSNFGGAGQYTDGDFNLDGNVGFADFLILSANYGQGADFTAGAIAAVPEPASMATLLVTLVGILMTATRKRTRRFDS